MLNNLHKRKKANLSHTFAEKFPNYHQDLNGEQVSIYPYSNFCSAKNMVGK